MPPSACDEKTGNTHLRADTRESDYVAMRTARDATLAVPGLLWPALQLNIRAGRLPPAEGDGQHFLRLPLSAPDFTS